MKKQWVYWWMSANFWLVLFTAGPAFVWLRKIDAARVTQTHELKLISFIVLLSVFVIPVIMQAIWLIRNLAASRNDCTDRKS